MSLTEVEVTAQVSRSAQRSYEKALDAYAMKDFPQTITELNKAVTKSPNYALAWFLLAQTHRDILQDSIAIVELQRALNIDDTLYKRGWIELAELLWQSGDYDAGMEALGMVVKKHWELKQFKWVRAGLKYSVKAIQDRTSYVIKPLEGDVNTMSPEYFPTMELSGNRIFFTKLVKSMKNPAGQEAVSYTHLTLPTIYSV